MRGVNAQMISKVRIGLITPYPIAEIGGTQIIVCALVESLSGHFEFVCASPDMPGDLPHSLERALFGHIHLLPGGKASSSLLADFKCSRIQIAHFHIGGLFGMGMGYLHRCVLPRLHAQGIQSIITTHGISQTTPNLGQNLPRVFQPAIKGYARFSRKIISHLCRKEIFVSQQNLDLAISSRLLAKSKTDLIYHSRLNTIPDEAVNVKEKLILSAGSITKSKGHAILVKAFARISRTHPDWRLVIVGPQPCPTALSELLYLSANENIEDKTSICGPQTFEELSDLYRRASVFVMPSYNEGLGLTLQEAIAWGCTPIGSDIGGIPELIKHGINGLLFPVGNVDQLTGALLQVLSSETMRQKFRIAGTAHLASCGMSQPVMASKYHEIYRDVLGLRP